MNVIKTKLSGVYIVEPRVFGDERGWFFESFSRIKIKDIAPEMDCDFVQDNHSYSKEKGVLRGIHYQETPMTQAKLVRCVAGAVLDVAVDLRKGSPTYKQWVLVELSSENKRQLFLPRGFGHGFVTLTTDVEFVYKTDNYYSYEHDRSILWSDSEIGIDWGTTNPILSEKDAKAPLLKDSGCSFVY